MKLMISVKTPMIEVLGRLKPEPFLPLDREVFLDGKRVPPTLEQIILIGLDTLTDDYLDTIIQERLARGE